jgi:DNA-binding CsgD family transcriptional regulator
VKGDVISVIETAYRMDQDANAWLSNMLAAAGPMLDRGMGCSAFLYDASDVSRFRILATIGTEERSDAIARAMERSTPERVAWTFRTQACRAASEGPDWENQPAAKLFRSWGIHDVFFVNGLDPSGIGCFLTAKTGARLRLTAAMRQRWNRIATHVAAGYRLQRRLATGVDSAAAILTPSAKLEHVASREEESARDALVRAVLAIERARGGLRREDGDEAVALWKGLVSARWTLVDHFDSDGKRYVIARENAPATPRTQQLTQRERQVVAYARMGHSNKLIAYELGISASTVGVLLWRAAAKLGTTTREELFAAIDRLDDAG